MVSSRLDAVKIDPASVSGNCAVPVLVSISLKTESLAVDIA